MYNKTDVVVFKGLNSNTAPELIDDGEARDIYNFRMEKIGKLVNRNGYAIGLYAESCAWFFYDTVPEDITLTFQDQQGNTYTTTYPEGTKLAFPAPPCLVEADNITDRRMAYIECKGIVGIGELILEEYWGNIDCDRLMVYNIRYGTNSQFIDGTKPDYKNDINQPFKTQRAYSGYFFAPTSGKYQNILLYGNIQEMWYNNSGVPFSKALQWADLKIFNKYSPDPQDNTMDTLLYAPNKEYDVPEDEWIKQYTQLGQYRHKLVISDMINGDMIIEDTYGETKLCGQSEHDLVLRANTLHTFDVNDVLIDLRIDANEENNGGQESGMALYNYTLPKRRQKVSDDNFVGTLSDTEWLGYPESLEAGNPLTDDQRKSLLAMAYIKARAELFRSRVKIKYVAGYSDTQYTTDANVVVGASNFLFTRLLNVSNVNVTYTNADNPDEFFDALGTVELKIEEYYDEDGLLKTDSPADVYIWNKYKLNYFVSSGKTLGRQLMTDLDRFFSKKSSATGRITQIKEIDEFGRQVPISAYRYRFVWDFGDGIYSAPSAELCVPELLWSAINDSDYINTIEANNLTEFANSQYNGSDMVNNGYNRPRELGATVNNIPYLYGHYDNRRALYPSPIDRGQKIGPMLFDGAILTTFGTHFVNIKAELYDELNHRFGISKVDNNANTLATILANDIDRGNLFTTVTTFISKSDLILKGFIYEGVEIGSGGEFHTDANLNIANLMEGPGTPAGWLKPAKLEWIHGRITDSSLVHNYIGESGLYLAPAAVQLVVPIFKTDGKSYTYNSLFDDEGRIRLAYRTNRNGHPQFQLVFPGTHPAVCYPQVYTSTPYNNEVVTDSPFYQTQMNPRYQPAMLHYPKHMWYEVDGIYLNVICDDNSNIQDYNNATQNDVTSPGDQATATLYNNQRPNSTFRAVKDELDRLSNIRIDDSEAVARLLLKDCMVEIPIIGHNDTWFPTKEYAQFDFIDGLMVGDGLDYADTRLQKGFWEASKGAVNEFTSLSGVRLDILTTGVTATPAAISENALWANGDLTETYNGVEAIVYGAAERLIITEQLTSYFPSSLLFNSPRMGLKIPASAVPDKAKKLLIFRTKSVHSNDYDPLVYGLVDTVDVRRADQNILNMNLPNVALGDAVYVDDNNDGTNITWYHGFYFFDDIKDSELDFSDKPTNYDGLREALHSRFNLALNERVYYANFYEQYNPLQPRKLIADNDFTFNPTTNQIVFNNYVDVNYDLIETTGQDFLPAGTYYYLWYYVDKSGVVSPECRTVINIPNDGKTYVVVWYLMPSGYDGSIDKLKIFRSNDGGNNFIHIEDVEGEDIGIFVDNGRHKHEHFCEFHPNMQRYESAVRWSQAFQPDWIKADSFVEYRSGDGKQITGLASQYGNLTVFKETSMHRVAVQNTEPPISRTDEISPEIGCIAPNTLINVDNTLYFLSWKGFMMYDNNIPQKIDIAIDEELQYVMKMAGTSIRDATCGYNAANNEIYLNIPVLKTREDILHADNSDGGDDMPLLIINNLASIYNIDYDNAYKIYEKEDWYYNYKRRLFGHIYVYNLNTKLWFKYGNQPTVMASQNSGFNFIKRTPNAQAMVRLYYSNSLGEMRSADILPSEYADKFYHAGIFIETPYLIGNEAYYDTDEIINSYYYYRNTVNVNTIRFPQTYRLPVRSAFKSKFFTGENETLIKRLRKTLLNLFSKGYIRIDGLYINYDAIDDRIKNNNWLMDYQRPEEEREKYMFNPTILRTAGTYGENEFVNQITGTYTNILGLVPQSRYGEATNLDFGKVFDLQGKPIKYSLEIYTEYRTQLNQITFYWRPIHGYLM